jgi:hypothetical protein
MAKDIHQCPCSECTDEPTGKTAIVHAGINRMVASLDEKNRRRFAGLWARQLGYGGIQAVARITGLSRTTITFGQQELDREDAAQGRVRSVGGGRKATEKKLRAS